MAVEQRAAAAELADLLARFRREAAAVADRAAWEALRVEWVGRKRGVVPLARSQAQGDRSRRAPRLRQGRPRAASQEVESDARSDRSSASPNASGRRRSRARRSTSPCPGAAGPTGTLHPITLVYQRDREHLPVDGLQRRRRPRDRDRLLQLRRAQLPRRPSGARRAGHVLPARRAAAAHPHLADPDPHAARAQAADARDRLRPRLPQRQRPAPLADVPSGRGAGDRPRHHLRPSQGRARDVLPEAVLAPTRRCGCGPATSRSPSRRRRSTSPARSAARPRSAKSAAPARAPAGWRSWARAWSIRACSRTCGIDPDVWSGFAFGGGIDRVAMARYGLPNIRMLFENDLRLLRQIHR